jgi:hypothetical protein
MNKEMKVRLAVWAASILMLLYVVMASCGWIQNVFAADADYQFVTPGTAFTMASTGATGATGYEWAKQPSGGAWATWDGSAATATDTLAAKAAARYRLRGYLTVTGWICDATGCTETGTRNVYGEFSDPSDWLIAAQVPACGKAVKPAKQ